MHPLDGVAVKMERAKDHLDRLRDDLIALNERDPYSVRVESDDKAWGYDLIAVVREQPNPYLGAVVGDAIHNLRSALNYIACALVERDGGTITDLTQFPIYDDPARFEKKAKKAMPGVTAEAFAFVERLQPYNGGNPATHPLGVLGKLSNADKHRVLTVGLFAPDKLRQEIRIRSASQTARPDVTWFNPGPLEDGAQLARVTFSADDPVIDVNVKLKLTTNVRFDGRWRFNDLRAIFHFVQNEIIERSQPFFR